jgi:nucleoside phosphorylase
MTSGSQFYLPLYLHYLDREFANAVEFNPTPTLIRDITRCLLLATPVHLYCNLSTAWECSASTPAVVKWLANIAQFGHLRLISHHRTLSEFLSARRAAYSHDRLRYPMYFSDDLGLYALLTPTDNKVKSATSAVHEGLLIWSTSADIPQSYSEKAIEKDVKKVVLKALLKRTEEAVTFTLFARYFKPSFLENPFAVGMARHAISEVYTRHYLDEWNGDLPTGVGQLAYFDRFAKSFPYYDVPLLTTMLQRIGLSIIDWKTGQWTQFLAIRGEQEHRSFSDALRILIGGLVSYCQLASPFVPSIKFREIITQSFYRIHKIPPIQAERFSTVRDLLLEAAHLVFRSINKGNEFPNFVKGSHSMQELLNVSRPLILLTVATEVERDAVIEVMCGRNRSPVGHQFHGDHTYYELGLHGGCEILLVETGMGSSGPTGALASILDAVRDIKPSAIIMVGIAFGLKQDKQKIGEILVSRQVCCYDLQRVTELTPGKVDQTVRGDRVTAAPRMLDRFRGGTVGWEGAKVRFGLILSGDKLVDSPALKTNLLLHEPEAIGGDMEAAGLYAAAYKGKVDWIVVKGISDWGEGKNNPQKDENQALAAMNAAEFVFNVIRQGGLAEGVKAN